MPYRMQYRQMCEKCGRVTITPILSDVTFPLYMLPTGEILNLTLCPEHLAEFQRFVSDFLLGALPIEIVQRNAT